MKKNLAIALLVLGIALAGFGVGNYVVLGANDMSRATELMETGDAEMGAWLAEDAQSRQKTGWVLVAVGAVLASAGVVVWKKK